MKRRILQRILFLIAGVFFSLNLSAQQINVKGNVKDTKGEPIIGANVIVKGTTNGTITDLDGNFQLSTSKGKTLVISFIGYKTKEEIAKPNMIVALQDDSKLLDDVVVIGYGQVKKNDATGAVTAIKPDELSKGITTNPQDMLSGKIAGVSVISDGGTPGAGATIRIRGGSSLNASNDPLIVIDGLAIDNDGIKGMPNGLAMVNPADIETFTVLKDASATAIYGSRASNGVIIITTKKGATGKGTKKMSVSYNGYVSMSSIQKKYEVLNGDDYRAYVNKVYNGKLPYELGEYDTNWQDQIYRDAVSTDHNVSLNGQLLNMPYRVSIGYTNNEGIVKTSKFERYTGSINLSPTFINGRLKMNINGKYMYGKNRYADVGGAVGSALSADPTRPVYSDEEQYKFVGGYWQGLIQTDSFTDKSWNYTNNPFATQNPLACLNLRDDEAKSTDVLGNIDIDYKSLLLPDLHIHANIG